MKFKRLLSLFLILATWLTLTACHADVSVDVDTSASSTVSTTTTTTAASADGTTTTTEQSTSTSVKLTTGGVTTATTPLPKPTPTIITVSTTTTTTAPSSTAKPTLSLTPEMQLVDAAVKLDVGESLPNDATLKGTVVDVRESYNAGYGNATFTIQVQGGYSGTCEILCYRVKPAEGSPAEVNVGDSVTLTGTIQNYKGTIEFYPATYVKGGAGTIITTTTTRPTGSGSAAIDEDGIYESKEDVALYLHTYGKLPKNFVTKSQYNSLGKPANKCCGGDRFYNKEGLLPNKAGRLYYECDIDTYGITSRGAKRIVYSNDGLIYYTGDHYGSFTLLYGEP